MYYALIVCSKQVRAVSRQCILPIMREFELEQYLFDLNGSLRCRTR